MLSERNGSSKLRGCQYINAPAAGRKSPSAALDWSAAQTPVWASFHAAQLAPESFGSPPILQSI